jgi:hypothetical protein
LARAPLRRPTRVATAAVAVGALLALAPLIEAHAQETTRAPALRPEVRVDYLGPRPHAMQAGLGVNVAAGTYVRLEVVGAGGASWRDGRSSTSARADAIARFALDPFRERRWGLSAGGGLSARYDGDAFDGRRRWRALIAVVLDLEGPHAGGVAPAFQLGLGGGVRAGVVVRGADRGRR